MAENIPTTDRALGVSNAGLDRGSKLFDEQLRAEVFKLMVRKDAKRLLDEQDLLEHALPVESVAKLVYDPLPEASPELMPGILPEHGTAAIVGETNTGKSLLSLELASSLLTGEPLWGSIVPTRTIKKVVYILGEHTVETLQGLYHRTGLPHAGDLRIIGPENLHPYKALVIGGVAQPIAIDRLLRWTDGAEFIVFDPLAGFVQGQAAENDNATMRTLIDTMSYIAMKQGATCLVLSHRGKPTIGEDGSEIRRSSYATRGATSIEDSLTHIYYLQKPISLKQHQGEPERFDLVVRKFKGMAPVDCYKLQREPITLRNTLVDVKVAKGFPSKAEKDEMKERISRLMQSNPGFTWDVALKLTADSQGMVKETLERWLST